MNKYIQNLKSKTETERKQYALLGTIICMVLVGAVWVYSLGGRFDNDTKAQARDDVKPFALLGSSLKNTYNNISASVGNAKSISNKDSENTESDGKIIDLIPVDQSTE